MPEIPRSLLRPFTAVPAGTGTARARELLILGVGVLEDRKGQARISVGMALGMQLGKRPTQASSLAHPGGIAETSASRHA